MHRCWHLACTLQAFSIHLQAFSMHFASILQAFSIQNLANVNNALPSINLFNVWASPNPPKSEITKIDNFSKN
jgi:hypothetical protein